YLLAFLRSNTTCASSASLVILLCFHHAYIADTANATDETPSYICSSLNGNGLYPKLINVWLISNISNTTNLTIPAVLLFFGFAIVFTPPRKRIVPDQMQQHPMWTLHQSAQLVSLYCVPFCLFVLLRCHLNVYLGRIAYIPYLLTGLYILPSSHSTFPSYRRYFSMLYSMAFDFP